jgi:hypothetical protein
MRCPAAEAEPWLRTELYFGLSRDAGVVGDAEWQSFVDREVSGRFPSGFTVIDAQGQWLSQQTKAAVREPSKVLIILRRPSAADDEKVEAIRRQFRSQFGQESVLKAESAACVAF